VKKLVLLAISNSIFFATGCGGGSWQFTPNPVEGDDPAIQIQGVIWQENALGNICSIKVHGRTFNVNPRNYRVSIFIRVDGVWWPKPLWSRPLIGINRNGYWRSEVVTGGHDEDMDAVHVFLVKRNTWRPPNGSFYFTLPEVDPETGRVAEDEVTRPELRPQNDQIFQDKNGVSHRFERAVS